jgi:16S rRNA (uracil1498-N3)-methyltransferase
VRPPPGSAVRPVSSPDPPGARRPGAEAGGPWPAAVAAAAQVFVGDLAAPALSDDDSHHLRRVLRLRPGALVVAADGAGRWRPCRLGREAALDPDGEVVRCAAPSPAVTVGFVPTKGDRPDWAVQKLTELGVDRIVLLRSARSVVRWDRRPEDGARALERLARVARAAAAQSRRPWLPALEGVTTVGELAIQLQPTVVHLADVGAPAWPGEVAADVTAVAIGPEGGWDDGERAAFAGRRLGLGPTVLRAETAAVAAGVLLCAERRRRRSQ